MAKLKYSWRSSNWVRTGCLVALAGCLIGLAAYLSRGSTVPYKIQPEDLRDRLVAFLGYGRAAPGHEAFLGGCRLLVTSNPADTNKLAEAVQEFDKAIEKNPKHAMAFFYRAEAYRRLGKTDAALGDYAEAIRLDKQIAEMDNEPRLSAVPLGADLAQAYFHRATLLSAVGNRDGAIDDYTEALNLNPEYAAAYCRRGIAYLKKGLTALAFPDLDEAIRLEPTAHDAYYWRAQADLATKQYADAMDDARRAIHLNAKCGDAFLALGTAILSSPEQQPEEAVNFLREAIRVDKSLTAQANAELARAYFKSGVNFAKAKRPLEAKKAFDDALRLDPKLIGQANEYVMNNGPAANFSGSQKTAKPSLGQMLADAGSFSGQKQFDKARDKYSEILAVDPTNLEALCGRGSAYLGRNDSDSALPDLQRAIDLAPKSAIAYCLRGQAYAMTGDYALAISDATEAIRLKPDYALAYFYRAGGYLKEKNFERALADLDEAEQLDRNAPTLDLAFADRARDLYVDIYESDARRQSATQDWDKAIDSLTKAIEVLNKTTDGSRRVVPLEKNRAERFYRQLAQVYGERGFDRANHGKLLNAAIRDLNNALGLVKDDAQVYRFCGLTCCLMARICQQRGQNAGEMQQWEDAIKFLQRAIWLDRQLEHELQYPLKDAILNFDRLKLLPVREIVRGSLVSLYTVDTR